jgi:NADH-quinone oxidoreductase subunit M
MFDHWPILTLLILLPILTGGYLWFIPQQHGASFARFVGLGINTVMLLLCWPLYRLFNEKTYTMQWVEQHNWIPQWHVHYTLGVDGIALPLIILTVFTYFIIMLSSWHLVKEKVAQYISVFLIMQGMVIGIFAAQDALLFYLFWEGMLIPMYLCIGIWGGHQRSYAAIKFFLFTFAGSTLLLISLIYLGLKANSFLISDFYHLHLTSHEQILICLGLFIAFAIKVPMWPVHTWLPYAHTEAPAAGSVILAALMLKIGAYGFLRFLLPITPYAAHYFALPMIILSLIAIVYIGLVAITQDDMKRLIAYSSVAHMGFVTLGCFLIFDLVGPSQQTMALFGLEGAMIQMIAHAFGSGAMFLAFGYVYERMHTRKISDFGGVASKMPYFTAFFLVFSLANVGMPGTSGFVGEFMVIMSAFKAHLWIAVIAALTLIIGPSYTLWMFKKVFYGPVVHDNVMALQDISSLEKTTLTILVLAILYLGLFPNTLIQLIHPTLSHILSLSLLNHVV